MLSNGKGAQIGRASPQRSYHPYGRSPPPRLRVLKFASFSKNRLFYQVLAMLPLNQLIVLQSINFLCSQILQVLPTFTFFPGLAIRHHFNSSITSTLHQMYAPGAYVPSLHMHSTDSKSPCLFILIHSRWQIKSASALAGFTRSSLYKPQPDPQTKASSLQLISKHLILSLTPNKHSMEGGHLRIFPVSLPPSMTYISLSPPMLLSMLEDKMPFFVVQDHLFGCFPHTIKISSPPPMNSINFSISFPYFPCLSIFPFLTWAMHFGEVNRGTWRKLLSNFMIVQ